jgi:hypothetical protein
MYKLSTWYVRTRVQFNMPFPKQFFVEEQKICEENSLSIAKNLTKASYWTRGKNYNQFEVYNWFSNMSLLGLKIK